jgi:hypothetical protein
MAFSKLEKAMALVIGLDIAAPGFSRSAAKAAVAAIGRATPPIARATTGLATRAALANPTLTGAALGLGALQTQPGQDLLEMAAEKGRQDRILFDDALQKLTAVTIPKTKQRAKSKFNKMVSAGMKAVKASTSYGPKGTIVKPKTAFKAVTTTASKILKGGKVAKSGIKRKLGLIMRKI